MISASDTGTIIIGLDGSATTDLHELITSIDPDSSIAVTFGSEGKGLRKRTRECCHSTARIGRGGHNRFIECVNFGRDHAIRNQDAARPFLKSEQNSA